MFCPSCGTRGADDARFCSACGKPLPLASSSTASIVTVTPQTLPQATAPSTDMEFATFPQRMGAFVIDMLPQFIPVVGLLIPVINLVLTRRGSSIGLQLVKARIVRENGDIAGFAHTFARRAASALSFLALGFGYWSALRDVGKQTWHDKLLHTYVVRDTPNIGARRTSSAKGAVIATWIVMSIGVVIIVAAVSIPAFAQFFGKGQTKTNATELANMQAAMDAMMADMAITAVNPQTTPSNNVAGLPTGIRTGALFPSYLRLNQTRCLYTWDNTGKVRQASCP